MTAAIRAARRSAIWNRFVPSRSDLIAPPVGAEGLPGLILMAVFTVSFARKLIR